MKKIHVAASPLTGTIFAGALLRDGRTWAANKTDVTLEALVAVAEHGLKFGRHSGNNMAVIELNANGKVVYRLTIEQIEDAK